MRDRFQPGKPAWITETADAACGGNPWAATFLDSFRFLDQLARLAKHGVQAVFHNTLAASEYGLLDQGTFAPRPNYWRLYCGAGSWGVSSSMPALPGRACTSMPNACAANRAAWCCSRSTRAGHSRRPLSSGHWWSATRWRRRRRRTPTSG
jgi:hypothetical protein